MRSTGREASGTLEPLAETPAREDVVTPHSRWPKSERRITEPDARALEPSAFASTTSLRESVDGTVAMSPQFNDDDVGKRVVNADGDEIGIIGDVEHGTAHVEPDPGITDTIKAKLGWSGTDDDAYPLQEEAVARVTDDEVRLERDLEGSGSGTTTSGTATGVGETSSEPTTGTDTGAGTTETDRDRGIDRDEDDISGTDDVEQVREDEDDELLGDDDGDRRR
ncbi:hypothetical protein [Natrinema sp. 74]|uniref:hypothetical protein n=1 Tax=Natrinema sp. 74 TaxID=3384159 RepID=UPI0038D3908F